MTVYPSVWRCLQAFLLRIEEGGGGGGGEKRREERERREQIISTPAISLHSSSFLFSSLPPSLPPKYRQSHGVTSHREWYMSVPH